MLLSKTTNRALYGVLALLSLIGVGIVVRRTFNLIPILASGYHLPEASSSAIASKFGQVDAIFVHYPILTLIHIIPGLLFVGLGPFQFSLKIRRRNPKWHRRSGRIFMMSALVIGVTALIMSFFVPSIGGFNQAAATTMFSLFFLFALFKAFRHILQRNSLLHREWIIRAYSIGLAVTSIRLINAVFFCDQFSHWFNAQ
jgi:uncharacterized membrane protein